MGIRFVVFAMIAAFPAGAQEQLHDISMVASARDFNLRGELINIAISPVNPDVISFESIEGGNFHRLWWFDTRTRELKQITPRAGNSSESYWSAQSDRNISWSPKEIDGKNWFLFVSSGHDGQENIYLGNTDSEQYLRLTSSRFVDHHPRWSPDGKSFVYVSSRSGSGNIYFVDNVEDLITRFEREAGQNPAAREIIIDGISSGKHHIRLTDNPEMDTFPDWSPDGRYIVYQGLNRTNGMLNMDLFLLDMHDRGSAPINLTQNPQQDAIQPRWSYDRNYIAYYASPAGRGGEAPSTVRLSFVEVRGDTATGKISSFVTRGTIDNNIRRNNTDGPLWGPGSRSLLYVKGEGNYTPILLYNTTRSGTVNEAQVLRESRFDIIHREIAGHISGNGATVAYLTYEDQDYRIYKARPGGGVLARRLHDVYVQPVDRVTGFYRTASTMGIGGSALTFLNQQSPAHTGVNAMHNVFFQFTVVPYTGRDQPYEVSIRTSFGTVKPSYRTDGGERTGFSYSILDVGGVIELPVDRVINRTSLIGYAGVGLILEHKDIERPEITRRFNLPFGFGAQYSLTQSLDLFTQFTFRNIQYKAEDAAGVYSTARTRGLSFGVIYRL